MKSFVVKGNICQTKTPQALDLHEKALLYGKDIIYQRVRKTKFAHAGAGKTRVRPVVG